MFCQPQQSLYSKPPPPPRLLQVSIMSDPVQTTSDSLSKLVRWAHSHGTICSLIPGLQNLTCGSYSNVLTPEPGPRGGSVPVAVWGCPAGHAYHWPLSDRGSGCGGSACTIQGQERFVGGRLPKKVKWMRFQHIIFHAFNAQLAFL